MKLWQLQLVIILVVLGLPLAFQGGAALSKLTASKVVKDECRAPKDKVAREMCKELGR